MQVITLQKLPKLPHPTGLNVKQVYESEHVHLMNLTLQAGQQSATHPTSVDVLFYCIRGKGKIEVGEQAAVISAGEIVVCPKDVIHTALASEGEEFELVVMETPTPAK